MKIIPILLLILCLIPFSFALDGGYVNETTRIWTDVITGASFYNSDNASLNVYDPTGNHIISHYNMSKFATGVYYHDFVPNQTGNYYAVVQIRNSTNDVVGLGSETLFILNTETNALVEYFGSKNMWENIILIGIFILLYIVGFVVKSEVLIFASGLSAFAMATQLTLFSSTTFNVIFSILIGLGAIYHGIVILIKKDKE